MQLSEELRRLTDPVWQAQHDHPFVRGIGDGTLVEDRFSFWLRQDYLFLIEYSRVLATCAARASDLETMTRFARLALETLSNEMSLHRSYAAEFGVSAADLEQEPFAPTTRAYTDFLVRTAEREDFTEVLASLLPLFVGVLRDPSHTRSERTAVSRALCVLDSKLRHRRRGRPSPLVPAAPRRGGNERRPLQIPSRPSLRHGLLLRAGVLGPGMEHPTLAA